MIVIQIIGWIVTIGGAIFALFALAEYLVDKTVRSKKMWAQLMAFVMHRNNLECWRNEAHILKYSLSDAGVKFENEDRADEVIRSWMEITVSREVERRIEKQKKKDA